MEVRTNSSERSSVSRLMWWENRGLPLTEELEDPWEGDESGSERNLEWVALGGEVVVDDRFNDDEAVEVARF